MSGGILMTKRYPTEFYEATFYIAGNPCMVNQPFIVNNIPVGVITEATEDYVKCNIFGRYIGTEYDDSFKSPMSIYITTDLRKGE